MRRWYANERRQGKAFEVGGIGRRKAKPGRILRPVRPISNRESLRISEKNDCRSTKLRANGNYIDNIDNFPFVLRLSKHERIFSHTLSAHRYILHGSPFLPIHKKTPAPPGLP